MKYESAERYAILYDLPKGEYRGAEVGGIRTRTIRAGNTIEVECYPLTRIGRCAKVEAVRRRKQRACQEALNRRNAEKLIRRLIEENFTPEDFVVTLTWDYGPAMNFEMGWKDREKAWDDYRLPWEEEDARREWNRYRRSCVGFQARTSRVRRICALRIRCWRLVRQHWQSASSPRCSKHTLNMRSTCMF